MNTFTKSELELLNMAQAIADDKETSIELVLETLLLKVSENEDSVLGYAFSDMAEAAAA